MSDDERYVARQAMSREEIHKLPNAELASSLSPEEIRLAQVVAKAEWDKRPMKRAATESAGEFNKRKREAAQTDKHEYNRLQRAALERALYDSKTEKLGRLTDSLTADITREKAEANEKLISDLEQKSRLESFQDGGLPSPRGTAKWEK